MVTTKLLSKLEELKEAREAKSYSPEPYLKPIPLLSKERNPFQFEEEEQYTDMTGETETRDSVPKIAVPEPYLDPIPLLSNDGSRSEIKEGEEEEQYTDMTGETEMRSPVSKIAVCPMYTDQFVESDGNSDHEYDYIEINMLRKVDHPVKGKLPSESKL